MIFSSLLFLFRFLPVFFIVYFLAPRRTKNLVLFLGSLVFYAWGEPVYVVLMLFSTLSDYVHGLAIEKAGQRGKKGTAKVLLLSSVVINLGLLGFFKYADFLIGTINDLTGLKIALLQLPLPIGISFYTFQTMSYTIDVYRQVVPAQKNIISFGAFVTMFPQLIAGPIVQYKDVAKELERRRVTMEGLTEGLRRFLMGLGKKVLLANQAGAMYTRLMEQGQMPGFAAGGMAEPSLTVLGAWLAMICFAFQIYFDFAGYSDMAVGLGRMMGFYFPENFNYPYMADSVTDFWRRWHKSLSGWFREYVYIPLGGNRKGLKRQVLNLLIVWMLTGIWHGAAWNFLLWGLWFGGFLILEKLLPAVGQRMMLSGRDGVEKEQAGRTALRKKRLYRGLYRIFTLLVVLGGWVLFSQTEPGGISACAAAMTGLLGNGFADNGVLYELSGSVVLLAALALGSTPLPACLAGSVLKRVPETVRQILETGYLAAVFLLSLAFLVDASYNPFLYFRF